MYDESKYINIDIFKGCDTYNYLEQFNHVVDKVGNGANYKKDCNYNTNKNEASFWFNPEKARYTPLPANYPDLANVQFDKRLNLTLHCANYSALLLIDTLYNDNKNILIEDICCGMGNLIFYLSKLGFKNFNAIDNFSQLPQQLFESLMQEGNIKYSLNNMTAQPIVSNLIAYIKYVKMINEIPYIPNSLELFLSYVPLMPNNNNLHLDPDEFFNKHNFTCFTKDEDRLLWGYCKEHKYDEFKEKIQRIKKL